MFRCICAAMVLLAAPAAAETNAYGTPWRTPWPEGCVNLKLNYNPPPCRREDVAYVDEHRVLHFLRRLPNQATRHVIKTMADDGFIQFLEQ
jgi:hypothetical protein